MKALQTWLTRITQWLQARDEPRVTPRHDRQGNLYYQVYDPMTGRSASFGSEAEIRWWLEQRYLYQE
jgi:membrane carboxypeptidase/penicillin-binding protein PbpC